MGKKYRPPDALDSVASKSAAAAAKTERDQIVKYSGCKPEAVLDVHGGAEGQELVRNIESATEYVTSGVSDDYRAFFAATMVHPFAVLRPRPYTARPETIAGAADGLTGDKKTAAEQRQKEAQNKADADARARASDKNKKQDREIEACGLTAMNRLKKITTSGSLTGMAACEGYDRMLQETDMLVKCGMFMRLYDEAARKLTEGRRGECRHSRASTRSSQR